MLRYFKYFLVIPHVLIYQFFGSEVLKKDVLRWRLVRQLEGAEFLIVATLLVDCKEFRNIFYYRIGWLAKVFSFLCPPLEGLYIKTRKIGPGLYIQHGFSTIITAQSIGNNFWINQQVTIGYTSSGGCPVVGDNVIVNAGAIIVGGVSIGDNSVIGAGAVIVKNVPPNCTVVGAGARLIKKDGRGANCPL